MNKDSFQSSGRKPSSITRPLTPGGTGGLPRVALGTADPELRAKAEALLEKMEPRIEFLIRVCQAVPLGMPGVLVPPLVHPMPPNGAQILDYLVDTLKREAKLAQAIQVAIYRYQQIKLSVGLLASEGQVDMEQLRRNVFFLTNLSAEFKGDKILALIFPPPTQRATVVSSDGESLEEKKRRAQQREEAVAKAVAFGQALAPRMAIAKLALETVEKGLTANVALVLTPQGRQAKLIAVSLTGDAERVAKLQAAHDGFEALKAAVPQVRAGALDLAALRPIVTPLGQLGQTFADHPPLRDLFTRASVPGA